MEQETLNLFLPENLLFHFTITDIKLLGLLESKKDCYYIYLEEKNELPSSYDNSLYESKGFYNSKDIQDFPVRGKSLYLVIKRRRWRLKSDKTIEIKSDYSFISEGSKLTKELADFLKGTGRDTRRYDK